jgi:RING finger protein 121
MNGPAMKMAFGARRWPVALVLGLVVVSIAGQEDMGQPAQHHEDVQAIAKMPEHHHDMAHLPPIDEAALLAKGLTKEQVHELKLKRAHAEFHAKHAGHKAMHAEMLLILMATMVICQIMLVLWKKHYFESYQSVTLLGMWLIPLYFSVELLFYRMLFFWGLFTVCTGYVTLLASAKPLAKHTPRRVYTYFTMIYKFTYFMTFFGYFLALIDFIGLGVIIQALLHDRKAHPLMASGLMFMFYGLYFGVLDRDFAEICARRMASSIGYYNDKGMPSKALARDVCAICGEKLCGDEVEKQVKLPCGHEFHEFCIRGWSIIGKKETCPYCNEKVDLKKLYPHPWTLSRQDVLFSQLLDALRYLVVWQPVIIVIAKLINHALGLI